MFSSKVRPPMTYSRKRRGQFNRTYTWDGVVTELEYDRKVFGVNRTSLVCASEGKSQASLSYFQICSILTDPLGVYFCNKILGGG